MNEPIRQLLLDQLRDRVVRARQRGFLSRLVSRKPWPEAIYAFEYVACDAERTHCAGEVARAWLIDSEATEATDAVAAAARTDRQGLWRMWFHRPRFSFHIHPGGQWVVYAMMDGPRAGHGGRYAVQTLNGVLSLVPDDEAWKS